MVHVEPAVGSWGRQDVVVDIDVAHYEGSYVEMDRGRWLVILRGKGFEQKLEVGLAVGGGAVEVGLDTEELCRRDVYFTS